MPVWWAFWLLFSLSSYLNLLLSITTTATHRVSTATTIGLVFAVAVTGVVAAYFYITYVRAIHKGIELQKSPPEMATP